MLTVVMIKIIKRIGKQHYQDLLKKMAAITDFIDAGDFLTK